MPTIDCRELILFLDDYAASTMDIGRRAAFDAHLAVCSACRDYLRTYLETTRLARGLPVEPTELPDALVRAILDARRTPTFGQSSESQ